MFLCMQHSRTVSSMQLLVPGLKGLSSFTTTATAAFWGRTNYDIRMVKTIALCAGAEPRRGQAGQRVLSVDQPSSAAVSTSVCVSVTHVISIQHESLHSIRTKDRQIYVKSLYPCLCVCVFVCRRLGVNAGQMWLGESAVCSEGHISSRSEPRGAG